MRRKDREVTDGEKINEIIKKSKICRVGFIDDGQVYIVPLNFGFTDGDGKRTFFFHSAKEGRKVDLVKQNPKVGFELDVNFELWEGERACDFSAGFQSIIGTGTMGMVEGLEEKKGALEKIMETIAGKGTWSFCERMIDAVAVFRLDVETISCKEHTRENR